MKSATPIVFTESGKYLVLCDTKTLLVHSGINEAPLWKTDIESPIVDMQAEGELLYLLDSRGSLITIDLDTQRILSTMELRIEEPYELAVCKGNALILSGDRTVLVRNQEHKDLVFKRKNSKLSIRSIAAGENCFAFACNEGIVFTSSLSGEPSFLADLQDDVYSIATLGPFRWCASGKDKLLIFQTKELLKIQFTIHFNDTPDCISSYKNRFIAYRLGHNQIGAVDLERQCFARAHFTDLTVGACAFGLNTFLAVALEGGIGNKLNLFSPAANRTDTHPTSEHKSWEFQWLDFDTALKHYPDQSEWKRETLTVEVEVPPLMAP